MGDIEKKQNERKISFLDKLRNDEFFSDENMIHYIKSFTIYVKKGSKNHLDSIPLLLSLTGKVNMVELDVADGNKNKNAKEVQFEEVIPPKLDSPN